MLISAVVWGYIMTPTDSPCVSLAYIVEDADERMYLTEPELTHLLKSEDLFPVGKQMNIVSLHHIEQAMESHPMVRTAECYLTPRNEMKIRLTQRVPLLRVQTVNEIYLIDTDRKVMQARAVVRDSVLVVTGAIGVKMASTQLADFAEWLEEESYWSTRINHLHVQSPRMIYSYLHDKKQNFFVRVVVDIFCRLILKIAVIEIAQIIIDQITKAMRVCQSLINEAGKKHTVDYLKFFL